MASTVSADPRGRDIADWAAFGQMAFLLVVLLTITAAIPFTHSVFWFTPLAFVLSAGSLYACWAVMSTSRTTVLEGSLQILHRSTVYHMTAGITYALPVICLFVWWKYRVIFRPSPPVIIRERVKKGVFDVVVVPRKKDGLAVVVPRAYQKEVWKGFAYSTVSFLTTHTHLNHTP